MSQGEVSVGILPGGGGTQRLPRLVGIGRALELMLVPRPVYAEEAERIGLITRACDPMLLMSDVMQFAQALAGMPPLAVHHIRKCVYKGMEMDIGDGLAMETVLFNELMASEEALERMSAYVATGQRSQGQIVEEQKKALERRLKRTANSREAVGKAPVKRTSKKATAKKAATAAGTVLAAINRSRRGVTNADLVERTGFDRKKVANLLSRLKRGKKIRNKERGVYVKA